MSAATLKEVQYFFHVSAPTTTLWGKDGMPVQADGTYDLYAIHCWIVDKYKKGNQTELKNQKLEEEIKKLQLNNAKLAEQYIERTEHENILTSRAISLRNYFERTLPMNISHLSMRTVDELRAIIPNFVKEMMAAYIGKKNIEDSDSKEMENN